MPASQPTTSNSVLVEGRCGRAPVTTIDFLRLVPEPPYNARLSNRRGATADERAASATTNATSDCARASRAHARRTRASARRRPPRLRDRSIPGPRTGAALPAPRARTRPTTPECRRDVAMMTGPRVAKRFAIDDGVTTKALPSWMAVKDLHKVSALAPAAKLPAPSTPVMAHRTHFILLLLALEAVGQFRQPEGAVPI